MTWRRGPGLRRAPPGRRQPRLELRRAALSSMAIPPQSGPAATSAASGVAAVSTWRSLAVATPHLAALGIMLVTEVDFSARLGFLLTWAFLNCFWVTLLRRAALSGALPFALGGVAVLSS